MTIPEQAVEAAAEKIYERLPYHGPGEKPAWVPRGNSLKQDEARRFAHAALEAALPLVGVERAALPPLRAREEIARIIEKIYEANGSAEDMADAILSRTAGQEWRDISSEMLGALHGMSAFIAVMFGRGPDATIPETVNAPIGVPIRVGEIMREATAVIAKAEAAFRAPPVAEPIVAEQREVK